MKILFVISSIDYADHIAIAHLSAIAKQLRHQTFIVILDIHNLEYEMNRIMPDVVAYSANVMTYDDIIQSHKKIKMKYNFVSIMGGPHATFSPETFEQSGMDAYCIGEGELAFKDFLMQIDQNLPFDNVLNLITKNARNDVRDLSNLDDLPMPDRDLTICNSHLKYTPKKHFTLHEVVLLVAHIAVIIIIESCTKGKAKLLDGLL